MTAGPEFSLNDNWWIAKVVLPSWAGFQNRTGPYGAAGPSGSDDFVQLVIAPEGRGTEPLTQSELDSAAWFLRNEALVSTSALEGLLRQYPSMQEQYSDYLEDQAELMPDVNSIEDFRNLIGVHSVNIHQITKNGLPYIGFELGCRWDDEHGLGILMHGTRVVEIGGADRAILLWIAQEDAEKP